MDWRRRTGDRHYVWSDSICCRGWWRGGNLRALVGTCVVSVAIFPALGTPFLADEKRHGLCVRGDVGGDVVVTDASVREVVGRAVVLDGVLGGDTGLLQTDERALFLGHLAPVI